MPTKTRNIIVQLLNQLGSNREAREYLRRFSSVDTFQFAVIKVGGEIIRSQLPQLSAALGFLHQVGLFPIVLHGAGPQLNEALEKANVATRKVDGKRVTTPEVMTVVRPVIYRENLRIVESLDSLGIRARSIQHGVFECDFEDRENLGLVGVVQKVHSESIKSAIEAQALPVVSCLGESPSGQVMNINADTAARELVLSIKPQKIIFLTPTGGLLNENGQLIPAINLATDFDRLTQSDWVHSGMLLKLEQIKMMLDQLSLSSSVSITSAKHLTRELFTYRGAGTLIRQGEGFFKTTHLDAEHRSRLHELIETSFERKFDPSYFDSIELEQVIWSESKRAAAVITKGHDSIPYLDKFLVTTEAQGEGLGAALWQAITESHPRLYWRSRENNPINSWYLKQADGCSRSSPWLVFHYGLTGRHSTIEACTQRSLQCPEYWIAEQKETIHD